MQVPKTWEKLLARPKSPLISRSNAAQAAIAVLDDVGMEGFSLALVAKKLSVQPPSLYHHFKDKNELLQEVVRELLAGLPPLINAMHPFEERLVNVCVVTRRTLLQHPNAAMLILQFFPRRLLLAAYEAAVAADPLPPEYHLAVIEGTEKLTFGSSLFAAAAMSRGIKHMPEFDAAKLPNLARAITANPLDDEALFAETIRCFLTGIAERARTSTFGKPMRTGSVPAAIRDKPASKPTAKPRKRAAH